MGVRLRQPSHRAQTRASQRESTDRPEGRSTGGHTRALVKGGGKLHIFTDSKHIAITLNKVKQGKQPKGKHQDLWTKVWEHRNRLDGVTWVKAHLTREEAEKRGIPQFHWELNKRADIQAGMGSRPIRRTQEPGLCGADS